MSIRQDYIDIVELRRRGVVVDIIKVVLGAFSLLYWVCINIRNFLYDKGIFLKEHKTAIPVISVGNITWGGTGKTSLVIFLAKLFAHSKKAVLTRGYGQDEVELLKKSLKPYKSRVFVGKDRWSILRKESRFYDLAILDDAFQYRKLKKDVNILLVNGKDPFGNGSLIPRGKLREPLSQIKRANILLVMYKDLDERTSKYIKEINPGIEIFSGSYRVKGIFDFKGNYYRLSIVPQKKWACFSAIGYPQGFLNSLKEVGINPVREFIYPDHHKLSQEEFRDIERKCLKENINNLIVTAKDVSRFRFSSKLSLFILEIELSIRKQELFKEKVARCTYS